ncbi:partial Calcium-transporting ATPase 1, partial [Gammaproteobacteria bacterium]
MPDFYRIDAEQALAELKSSHEGLTEDEVTRRREEYGRNALPTQAGTSLLKVILSQFTNIMVIVLLVAALISLFLGDVKDVIVILVIVVLNAALGTFQEYRAEQSLAALSAMQVPLVRVRRAGEVHQINAEELVPGDVVLLSEGDNAPADGRIINNINMQVEEAALTGESQAVYKDIRPIEDADVALGDRKNMVFMGTAVTYGRGEVVVTNTGLETQLGKIAKMLMGVEEGTTPLQKKLNELSIILVRAAIGIVVVVFIAGLLRGIAVQEMLITSISLAVAAVPEGLPAIVTISLSLGAARMVKRNALIRRLPAV